MDYDLLNSILEKEKAYLKGLKFWCRIAKLYLKIPFFLPKYNYEKRYSKVECYTDIYEYLSSLSIHYANAFYILLNEIHTEEKENKVDYYGNIFIEVQEFDNNLETKMKIIHEITHKLSKGNSYLKNILGEFPTIRQEFYYGMFLLEEENEEKEIYAYFRNRINKTKYSAIRLLFQRDLLQMFEENKIKKNTLEKYLNRNRNKEICKKYLEHILTKGKFNHNGHRYVIGTILTAYFLSHPEYTLNFKKIIEILGKDKRTTPKDMQKLEQLGIPIIENNLYVITNSLEQELEASLIKLYQAIERENMLSLKKV